ncbi:hypothetical protein BDM02DRAFT_3192947 [Thelephora ganbajun]|uniref:Uncharacterized protein n=1 Tax=Thelephora ganbajun TaxID=370292 RepID=A0ACB6YYW6_THEGA|nr:hypothetical protein BDM02DRAFT_3192947 [Thelephora ganbajun]
MAIRVRKAKLSALDDKISLLNGYTAEHSPTQQVFSITSATLTLFRVSALILLPLVDSHWWPNKDKVVDDEVALHLSEYCFNTCKALKTSILVKNAEGLGESIKLGFKDLEKVMHGIERALRRVTSTPHTNYSKGKAEGQKLEIQRILGVLAVPSSPLAENGVTASSTLMGPDHCGNTATASFVESGTSLAPLFESSCAHLSKRAFSRELPSLIEAIFGYEDEANMIHCLSGDDAQNFADMIDQACSPLARHHQIPLIGNQFCWLGTGNLRFFATDPEEMSQGFVQDVRSQRNPPEVTSNPSLLRPTRHCAIPRWFCRCVEGKARR